MSTVAEGIETREQGELLRSLGCDKGQGYYYGRPLASDDLASWSRATAAAAADPADAAATP